MLGYRIVPVTPFQQNCTLLWCTETGKAAIVDPGGEPERILAAVRDAMVRPERILLTHGHIDHVGAAGELALYLDLPIQGPHASDAFLLQSLPAQCAMFGFPSVEPVATDRFLAHGERVRVGDVELEVIHCPGHTPGHLAYISAEDRLAQVGDVLFRGSIGRTDLPRGSYTDLIASIRERLFPLGDDVRFIPGHGPMSDFGTERRSNPFVGAAAR
jgi:glyoxylase-like metal-dependent hydrolase (beta-lactamase superfamily II)